MSFLNPFVALAIAAAVIPALLLLYFLKLRRREEVVSSTLLWRRAIQDLQVNAPFQRLRRNLLLFLQLVVLALALLALARPVVRSEAAREERVVILIDRSASMNAVEAGGGTRLDDAKEQAVRLVRTLNRAGAQRWFSLSGAAPQTQAMVVAFADRATVVAPFTTSVAELEPLIRAVEPTDASGRLSEALDLAAAYMTPPSMTTDRTPVVAEAPARLVLFSDGRLAGLEDLTLRQGAMEWVRTGAAEDNVGVIAMRTERNYETPDLVHAFVQVRNFGPQPVTTDVALYVDGVLSQARVRTITLDPPAGIEKEPSPADADAPPTPAHTGSSAAALSFELTLDRAAVLEARLSRPDALPVDNTARAIIPPPRKLSVLTVTPGNYFIESALIGLPLADRPFVTPQQFAAAPQRYLGDERARPDVVIFDGYSPAELPPGNYLFINALPPHAEVSLTDPAAGHFLIWWDESHPVLRHVGLDSVYVASGRALKLPRAAQVLVEGPHGPVLARFGYDGRDCLILSFAILESDWWRTSLPQFLYNAVRFLGGVSAESGGRAVRPGETVRVPLPDSESGAQIVRPDGQRVPLTAGEGGAAYFGGTLRAGIYEVDPPQPGLERFAVNLEDEQESHIAPVKGELRVGSERVAHGRRIETATPEVWRWFVGAALALVLLEWWIYNRRVMI